MQKETLEIELLHTCCILKKK